MWALNDELSWLSEYSPVLVDSNYDIIIVTIYN